MASWIGAFAEGGLLWRLSARLGLETFVARNLYSFWGCMFVLTLCHWPCVAIACAARLETLPRNLEDAGRLYRGPWATALRIAFPQTLAVAIPAVAVVYLLVARLWRTAATSVRAESRYLTGVAGHLCSAVLLLAILGSIILPLVSLTWDCQAGLTFDGALGLFKKILIAERATLLWTVALAAAGAAGCVVVGFLVAVALRTTAGRPQGKSARATRSFVWAAFLLPLVLPGMLVGLGLSSLYNHGGFRGAIFASPAIVVLAYISRFGFIGLAGCCYQLSVVGRRSSEAAAAHGVPTWRRVLRIDVPLGQRMFLWLWLLIVVLCMGELNATMMIDPPGLMTLPKRIANLVHYSYDSYLAAMCLLMVMGVLVVYLPAVFFSRRGVGYCRKNAQET